MASLNLGLSLIGFNNLYKTFKQLENIYDGGDWMVGTSKEYAAKVEFGDGRHQAYPYFKPGIKRAFAKYFKQEAARADSVDDLIKAMALHIQNEIRAYMREYAAATQDEVWWRKGGHLIDTKELHNSIRAFKL